MEKNFTKGEWKIDDINSSLETKIVSNGKRICEVKHYGKKIHPAFKEPSFKEGKSNAKLIAAAPDLLEALLSIENDDNSIPAKIWEMRNKAIEKATK